MFRKTNALLVLILFFFGSLAAQNLRGRVWDAADGAVLPAASLILESMDTPEADKLQAVTNEEGQFAFETVLPGYYRLTVSYTGYANSTLSEILVQSGKETVLDLPISINAIGLNVCEIQLFRNNPAQTDAIPLTIEQTLRVPAMFYDPARLAMTYPGVVTAQDGTNQISMRGAPTGLVKWRLFGVEVVNPNHLTNAGTANETAHRSGGGVLMLSAQMLGNSRLYQGVPTTGIGNAACGVFDLEMRPGNSKRHEFTAQTSLVGVDFAAEGPMSKNKRWSYLANVRGSTVGLLSRLGVDFSDEKIDFADASAHVHYQGKNGEKLSLFGVFGTNSNRFNNDPIINPFSTDLIQSNVGILGAAYKRQYANNWVSNSTIAFSRAYRREEEDSNDFQFSRIESMLALNSSFGKQISQSIWWESGIQLEGQSVGYKNQFGFFKYPLRQINPQVFSRASIHAENFSIDGGIQAQYYFLAKTITIDPRFRAEYRFSDVWSGTLSLGQSSQLLPVEPVGLGFRGVFDPFRLNEVTLKIERSAENWTTSLLVFSNQYSNLPQYQLGIPGGTPDYTNSFQIADDFVFSTMTNAVGLAFTRGIELSFNRQMRQGFYLRPNFSYIYGKYQDDFGPWFHLKNSVGPVANVSVGKEWTKIKNETKVIRWGLGSRSLFMGGVWHPSIVSSTTTNLIEKNPNYFRTDLRVYRKVERLSRRNSTVALDIQNMTNRKNVWINSSSQENIRYHLGLIPNLSWRMDF